MTSPALNGKEKVNLERMFDEARGLFLPSVHDPVIPRHFVTLYEIANVLERLIGVGRDGLHSDHTDDIYERLLSALIDQSLIARILENDMVIPVSEWSDYRNTGVTAFRSGFMASLGFLFHEDQKFRDKTAVIPVRDATGWIRCEFLAKPGPSKAGAPRKIDAGTEVYWEIYPDGHQAAGAYKKVALHNVNAELKSRGFETISMSTFDKIFKKTPNNPTQ